ncbi:MAG: hypothetical protein SWK76_15545 [Actinomycetota bacterium]|nr:hypothetical protein [Actinomycetota bacterium]
MRITSVVTRRDDSREERLEKALRELCELAMDEGADQSAVIEREDMAFREPYADPPEVPVEERSLF